MSAMLEFDNTCPQISGVPKAEIFQNWLNQTLTLLPEPNLSKPLIVGVRIVDEEESAQLNKHYRQKDYATNVLSFSSELPEAVLDSLDEIPLGDLAICAPVVARESEEQHKPLQAHWAHIFIHGLLHLHGFDHVVDADAEQMEALEVKILETIGVANPYI